MEMASQDSVNVVRDFAGRGGTVDFVELHSATNLLPRTPRFLFGTFPEPLARMYYGQHHLGAMGVYKMRGFEVIGPYGFWQNGEPYCCPEGNIHQSHALETVDRLDPVGITKRRKFVTGTAAHIAGPGYTVFGHWLSDFLPKLFLFELAGYDLQSLKFLVPQDTPRFGLLWLELLGIPAQNLLLYDPHLERVWVEELLLPTILHNGVRASTLLSGAARLLQERAARCLPEGSRVEQGRRLFVSRSKSSQSRPLQNRERIEEIARNNGLELVYPETLSLLDQTQLFASAALVVGEYGSALHGTLFSPPGTIVCALRGSLQHPGFIQSGMGYALGQPTGYVIGATDESDHEGRFNLPEGAFSDCLRVLTRNGVGDFE